MRRATLARILVCTAVISLVMGGTQAAVAGPSSGARKLQRHGLAVYEWHSISELASGASRARLRFLRRHGFTTVYIDLGEYLDVADLPETPEQQARLGELSLKIKQFVANASSFGLAVHAVGASPTWTEPERRYLGPKLVRLVGQYNATATASERLQGVQVDIEPYLDPSFFDDEQSALVAYLETLQGIVQAYQEVHAQPVNGRLQLGFAIPFWFDGEGESPGPVTFDAATKPAAFHLIDMLKDLPDAYVLVMAYRNFTSGRDGSIRHLRSEFRYASSVGAKSGIVVGQEFAEAEPAKITFHGRDRSAFEKAAKKITKTYGHLPQFRGLSVDDVDAYMAADD